MTTDPAHSSPRTPRLPGESPCHFVNGWDGWSNCAVHGWSGAREDRRRVLVCPDVNSGAERQVAEARRTLLAELRAEVERLEVWLAASELQDIHTVEREAVLEVVDRHLREGEAAGGEGETT